MSWDDSTYNWAEMQHEATIVLEGDFPVTVVKSEAVKSANGKDMIKVKFKINAGNHAGRALFTNFVISPESPGAMRMFFTQLAVFGLDNAFFASIAGQPPAAIAQALDGRSAIAVVKKGQWQGADREEINGYKPALGGHGGGAFVAGLGTSIGGSVGSSPLGNPSPSSFSSPIGANGSGTSPSATVESIEAVAESGAAEPATAPPPAPAF